jgi:hypothetical protein
LANSNFAEVGDSPTNLILSGIKTVRQKPWPGGPSTPNFGIQA